MSHPRVELESLDTLWFQVAGTICNLACHHCLVSSSPTNRTHEMLTMADVRPRLDEAVRLGVREYYFTGGEPFLNPELEAMLAATLELGPTTVLTNGLLLDPARCGRLATLAAGSPYSLDLRVSLDGLDAATNDAIRGEGTFDRALQAVRELHRVGLDPVLTVTEVCDAASRDDGRRAFVELLREVGVERPRLKILPLFRVGAEVERGGAYEQWQRLIDGDVAGDDWSHLQCASCRVVTARGVWVCPILVNEPEGRMGATLADTLAPFPLRYQACWTCHVQGASCRT